MDSNEEQNNTTANGTTQTSGNSRTAQIAHMSLYERQAVQALQALQRQPNAAQYFQQLMLQQQISSAQLQNLAAVQQATLAASRQTNTPSNSGSQTASTVNQSTTSAGGATPRPHGPATSATNTALNQSVLIGSNSAGQGQMYLRVNRSLRTPLASQFIFMPGGTATATVATVAQAQPQQQQQQQQHHEAALANGGNQTDNDQVQNLALHHASTPRTLNVKSELPERKDAFNQQQQQQQQPFGQTQQVQPQHKRPNPAAMTVTPAASVAPSPSSSALPLSQLLLSPSSTPVILVPTSSVSTSSQGYPIASVTPKTNMNTQTLVVQPLQQANSTTPEKCPVPIQPKTPQGHRLPVQLPPRLPTPILPAPPSGAASTGGQSAPHVPVQLTKPLIGSLKRKSDCDVPSDIMTSEALESLSMKDSAPPLSPAPKDSAPPAVTAFSCPPTLSLPPPLSRVGLGDKDRPPPPQAVVKPQVLTHLIEGFVIQEGAEPFPCNSESSHSGEASSDGEDDVSASVSPTSSSRSGSRAEAPQSDCSAPGAVPLDGSSFLSSTPAQWSVDEVCRFISSLQGCEELAAQFLSQEIDGQALLLLREDHLISTMNIKLGPALKICASINSLRE
ncbi:hypothetical protein WMY93_026547 [Mugilogobius chulae]|uniref:SAM domain-containing protein n=1 Tax=Mugilogobius chulae TaxID=88201 RepID=A0AAW0N2M5_9GOBI